MLTPHFHNCHMSRNSGAQEIRTKESIYNIMYSHDFLVLKVTASYVSVSQTKHQTKQIFEKY